MYRLFFALVCSITLFVSSLHAEYKYDWKTGNSYNYETDSSGDTTVQGRNTTTGVQEELSARAGRRGTFHRWRLT